MTKRHRLGRAWGRSLKRDLIKENKLELMKNSTRIFCFIRFKKPSVRNMNTPKKQLKKIQNNIQTL